MLHTVKFTWIFHACAKSSSCCLSCRGNWPTGRFHLRLSLQLKKRQKSSKNQFWFCVNSVVLCFTLSYFSSTPDPLDSETITATHSSRRSRSSRSRSNRSSRQHRRRRRHNRSSRMTTDATVQAASSTQISNENNQNQVNVTRPMTPEEEAEKCQVTFEVFF